MGFRTTVESAPGSREIVRLFDDATGASAAVAPALGFNLFDLKLPVAGTPTAVLATSPRFLEAGKGGAGDGLPILFPFPNRIRGGSYSFAGKAYHVATNLGPDAIHGFAHEAAWQVVDRGATRDSAFVVGRFRLFEAAPVAREAWPTDATLDVRFDLAGKALTMTSTVANPTARDLPFGFGIHPYFRLPLAPGADPAETAVVLPAARTWTLDAFLPTGEVRDVDDRLDFRAGKPRAGLKLDDVLTGLSYEGEFGFARLLDLARRTEVKIGFDRSFRELVVYTPNAPDVLSIEPYTQTTDAINLQANGKDAGLRVLRHDESARFVITIATADLLL